jgi:Ca2+-binding RTX toxin-like protein
MPYFTSVLDDRNQPLPLSSNPTHWFTAAADGTVTGTNGPDAIYATSGHATLIGNGGDDTFYVNSHDTVAGGAGVDLLGRVCPARRRREPGGHWRRGSSAR